MSADGAYSHIADAQLDDLEAGPDPELGNAEGHPPYKVFWSADGPRIEAVFPHT